jgi:hypothetical protein
MQTSYGLSLQRAKNGTGIPGVERGPFMPAVGEDLLDSVSVMAAAANEVPFANRSITTGALVSTLPV